MPYYVGQRLSIRVAFEDADGVLFDPVEVRATFRVPDANRRRVAQERTTYAKNDKIRRVSTGVYSLTLKPTAPGDITVAWESLAEGEETIEEIVIPVVLQPEIIRTFTGPNADDNRFTGPNTDDNR